MGGMAPTSRCDPAGAVGMGREPRPARAAVRTRGAAADRDLPVAGRSPHALSRTEAVLRRCVLVFSSLLDVRGRMSVGERGCPWERGSSRSSPRSPRGERESCRASPTTWTPPDGGSRWRRARRPGRRVTARSRASCRLRGRSGRVDRRRRRRRARDRRDPGGDGGELHVHGHARPHHRLSRPDRTKEAQGSRGGDTGRPGASGADGRGDRLRRTRPVAQCRRRPRRGATDPRRVARCRRRGLRGPHRRGEDVLRHAGDRGAHGPRGAVRLRRGAAQRATRLQLRGAGSAGGRACADVGATARTGGG